MYKCAEYMRSGLSGCEKRLAEKRPRLLGGDPRGLVASVPVPMAAVAVAAVAVVAGGVAVEPRPAHRAPRGSRY